MADDPETGCPDPAKKLPKAPPSGCIPCAEKAAADKAAADKAAAADAVARHIVYEDKLVQVRTGIQAENNGAPQPRYADAIAIKVKCCKNPHVVQFIYRQVLGKDGVPKSANIRTTGGSYALTTDPTQPVWNTDSASKGIHNPNYESGFINNPAPDSLTVFDQPTLEAPGDPALGLSEGEKSCANFQSYAICNGQVRRQITWSRCLTHDGTPSYTVSVTEASALPQWATDLLKTQGYNNAP